MCGLRILNAAPLPVDAAEAVCVCAPPGSIDIPVKLPVVRRV